jgi:hypothetical protein
VNKTTTCLFLLAAAMLLTGCESPLNKAALAGNTAKIQQLLDNGADINKRTLAYSRTPLLYAAETGNTNVVELLLSKGANINAPDAIGYTALMLATVRGHAECVKVLLAHGANIDQRTVALSQDLPSLTALDLAIKSGHPEIEQLIKAASRKGATQSSVPTTLPPPAESASPF